MKKKVLIVDDIPEYIETLRVFLEDRFEVMSATNLNDAKKLLEENPPSLAIIDIRLDENDPNNKDGLTLLEWTKNNFPNILVIVMSAYKEFDFAVEALNQGADYFAKKPLNPNVLNEVIEKLI